MKSKISKITDPTELRLCIPADIYDRIVRDADLSIAQERRTTKAPDGAIWRTVRLLSDLAENAYVSDSSGNYLKTLNGLCEVCRPYMQMASKVKRYGGAE